MLSFTPHFVSRQGCIAIAGLDFINRAFPNHEPCSLVEFQFVGIRPRWAFRSVAVRRSKVNAVNETGLRHRQGKPPSLSDLPKRGGAMKEFISIRETGFQMTHCLPGR